MSKNRMMTLALILLGVYTTWCKPAYAQDSNVVKQDDEVIIVRIPDPPEVESLKTLKDLDKAIELKLEESFIIKITESMKKNPF